MAILLALITSATWGTSDFFGGLAARRDPVARVMLWAHGLGLVAIAACAPFLAERIIGRDLIIGVAAGLIGLVGLLLLYESLSRGPMALIAPLSAVTAALVPVLWGLRSNDPLSNTTLIGLLLGLAAVVAISWEGADSINSNGSEPNGSDSNNGASESSEFDPKVVAAAIVAGTCFGSIVLLYDATDAASAPWPIVSGRAATTLLLIGFALARRQPLAPGASFGFAVVAGLGDTFANVTLLAATSVAVGSSELSVVAVVTAFYPAATVIWARVMLHERLGPIRIAGLCIGMSAVALMTLG